MQLIPSQWLSRAAQPWRCFSHVAHPMESQESTLLNQPCNWSHKMKAVHHHQEPCYIISMKLLKYNPWSCCGEVYVSQRMESWKGKERKIVDYLEQRLTFLSRYESLASVGAANLKQWRKHSYKTTCHEMWLWLNDKKNKELQTKLGMTHGSPAAFCIAYDSRGLMERILWKGRQRIILVWDTTEQERTVFLMHREKKKRSQRTCLPYFNSGTYVSWLVIMDLKINGKIKTGWGR